MNNKQNALENITSRVGPLRYLWRVGQILATIILIYWVIQRIDWSQVWPTFLSAKLGWLAVAFTYPFLTTAIDALRFQLFFGAMKRRVAWRTLFRVNLVGMFFDNFLPSNIGSDTYRTVSLSQHYGPREVLATVIIGRVLGWFGLLILGLAGVLVLQNKLSPEVFWGGLFVLAVGLCIILFGLGLITITRRWHNYRWYDRLLQRWQHLELFNQTASQLLTARSLIPGLGLSLFLHIVVVIASVVTAKAYGVQTEQLLLVAFVLPLGSIASMLPISIAGLGVRETVTIYLLSKLGIKPEVALAISISLYVMIVLASLIGIGVRVCIGIKNMSVEATEHVLPQ